MPRKPATAPAEPTHLLQVKLTADRMRGLDEIRRHEPDFPTRSEMVRRMIERIERELATREPKKRR